MRLVLLHLFLQHWSRLSDSNRGQPLYKSGALPTELRRQYISKTTDYQKLLAEAIITFYFPLVSSNPPQCASGEKKLNFYFFSNVSNEVYLKEPKTSREFCVQSKVQSLSKRARSSV